MKTGVSILSKKGNIYQWGAACMDELKIRIHAFTMDCRNPEELARFYAALLNWKMKVLNEDWAYVYSPENEAMPCILFQRDPDYVPPVWPGKPGEQQQMAHLDFDVGDLDKAVEHAMRCGARAAEVQFADNWKVMLDPAGHPFCLCMSE